MKRSAGFSMLELLVAVGVLGVFLSIGAVNLRPERFAVNQAASGMAAQVTRARFEALKRNEPVGLLVSSSGSGSVLLFEDLDRSMSYTNGDRTIPGTTVTFGVGDFARTTLAAASCGGATGGSQVALVFNGRGLYQGAASRALAISDRSGSFTRYVLVSPQGRARTAGAC